MPEVRMSLAEAGAILRIAPNSVRSRWKAGKLRGDRDNEGRIWVWLDPAAAPATPVMVAAISPEPVAASATPRDISEVVAVCSSTAEAMVVW